MFVLSRENLTPLFQTREDTNYPAHLEPISRVWKQEVLYEPCHEKTCVQVSDQVRHKMGYATTEDG